MQKSAEQNVRVVCRFKPLGPTEKPASLTFSADGRGVESFAFERIFRGAEVTNQQVYAQAASDLAKSVVDGFNVTVFAYGQTGSGKTHTMSGTPEDPGIIPRLLEDVFGQLEAGDDDCTASVQFVEIYNDEIFSLLPEGHGRVDDSKKQLQELEDRTGWVIKGVKQRPVSNVEHVMKLFEMGQRQRHTGATMMNERSSRSHSVLILEVSRVSSAKKGGKAVQSRVVLVDLAGSERQEKTGAQGDRFEEAKSINGSLFELGNVIEKLSECDPKSHVPYRNSVLTKVLRASLGGNSKTLMIIACSEAESNQQETVTTLKYGARASKVKNVAHVNETMTLEQAMARITELEKKLAAGQVTPRSPSNMVDKKRIEELEGQLVIALKRAEDAEALLEEVHRDMEATDIAMGLLETRVNRAEEEAEERRLAVLGLQSERDELKEQHRVEENALKEEIASLKLELKQKELREASMLAEAAHQKEQIGFLEQKLVEAAEDTADIEQLSAHVDKKFAECKQLKKDLALLKDACDRHESREQELEKDCEEAHKLLAETEKKLAAVVHEKEARQKDEAQEEESDGEAEVGAIELQAQSKLMRTAAIYHELHAMNDGVDRGATKGNQREVGTNTDWTGLKGVQEDLSAVQARVFGYDGKVK